MRLSVFGLLVILASGMLVVPLAPVAQPTAQHPRIGNLAPGTPPRSSVEAFRQGLHALGYVEGQTIALEIRWDEGQPKRWPELAAELVARHVDVLVAGSGGAAQAAKRATTMIPIVMLTGVDPVEQGLIASLARPGGNITGLSVMTIELTQKRLELLKEAVPSISRVAVLWGPISPLRSRTLERDAFEGAARVLGVQLVQLEVHEADDLDRTFKLATEEGVHAVITAQHPVFHTYRTQIAALALQHRLPLISGEEGVAEAGGLMTYGANITDLWRRTASYVDRILRGTKPADLPVEQPTKFELVINLKAAQALDLTIPPTLLFRADEVIR
jgi:putative ABC transport system substrate-binding protein